VNNPNHNDDRIRRYLRGEIEVTSPREAATVVLLRDGHDGLQACLLRRSTKMDFAAGMYVFPGGSVDPADADARVRLAGPPVHEWTTRLECRDDDSARSLLCAAVRETFEESGVLLVDPDSSRSLDPQIPLINAWRQQLLDGSLDFVDLLHAHSFQLRCDQLRPWSRWVTPEWSRRRFDTRFFIAATPPNQHTSHLGTESDEVVWMPVASAVTQFEAGAFPMMKATVATLRELSRYSSVSAAFSARRDMTPITVQAVLEGDDSIRHVVNTRSGPVPAETYAAPPAEKRH
jgi:8-oxo-dGTP pyrophosphatase MutT (NUDIX family)